MAVSIIVIATLAALLGFFLGVRSKAVSKRRAIDKEKRQVESLLTITHTSPPPPPPDRFIREGEIPSPPRDNDVVNHKHKKPGKWSSYNSGTFAKTSVCTNCRAIAYYAEMWSHEPCPYCGGAVKNNKPSRWDENSKTWIESTAK